MAVRLPPVNATLTKVYGIETVNVGGEQVETEVEKWSGSVSAFTTEKNSIEAGPNGPQNVYSATAVVPAPLGDPPIEIEVGDLIDYERNGSTEHRQVDLTEDRQDFGFTRLFVSEPN